MEEELQKGFQGSQFGTPESDDFDTHIDTWRLLVNALKLSEDTKICDPFFNNGKAKILWEQLGFDIFHNPLDFYEEETIQEMLREGVNTSISK